MAAVETGGREAADVGVAEEAGRWEWGVEAVGAAGVGGAGGEKGGAGGAVGFEGYAVCFGAGLDGRDGLGNA